MAKSIMIQGTMSNAGKSLIAAGLCRIFRQDGYRTAPFKSQNMALNSFVTRDGLEMGRAQVMQAEAAGIEPDVRMNPILLKPVSDCGSQVIVNGEVLGSMSAADYFRYKKKLRPKVLEAYEKLSSEYDIVVLEGAGSPAEINLKSGDIVNMGMAKMAGSPVLLVGDIDRGGVFASLYGTIALLDPDEQEIVKGLVINKFRGDAGILRPGLSTLEQLTAKPVVGVVPYTRLELDDEDSLAERLGRRGERAAVDVAVVRLPHLSNFTDFNALGRVEGVGVRYALSPRELREPDLLILPGTKNTIGDLAWLRGSGMEAAVKELAGKGVPVFGVCGGYQMLGETVSDPEEMESGGAVRGIGLLPAETVFEDRKVRTRVRGTVCPVGGALGGLSGAGFEGYEIHMGRTECRAAPLSRISPLSGGEVSPDGGFSGNVYGTYVHGFFDSAQVCTAVARALMEKKGIDASGVKALDVREEKERQYDLLADTLRKSLDMDAVYRILERGL